MTLEKTQKSEKLNKETKLNRLARWSREQLEEDVRRLWETEKSCLEEIRRLSDLLSENNICPDCGTVNKICDCPFG